MSIVARWSSLAMWRFLAAFAFSFSALLFALPAMAQAPKQVLSGKPTPLTSFPFVDKSTCQLSSLGEFVFDKQPENGKVEIRQVIAGGEHKTCGHFKGKVSRLYYTSRPGYVGPDVVEFLLVVEPEKSNRGARETRRYRILVNVR